MSVCSGDVESERTIPINNSISVDLGQTARWRSAHLRPLVYLCRISPIMRRCARSSMSGHCKDPSVVSSRLVYLNVSLVVPYRLVLSYPSSLSLLRAVAFATSPLIQRYVLVLFAPSRTPVDTVLPVPITSP